MAQGRKEEAEEILRKLMQQRGFYPMVAAQRLGVEYPLQVDQARRRTIAWCRGRRWRACAS
jgi:peptidoglycan lytic transglycosylase (EC:3.2.1.-)